MCACWYCLLIEGIEFIIQISSTCIDLLINNDPTNSRSISGSLDWTRVLSCLLAVYLSFAAPSDDPDVSRLLIESLPFEGDLCVHNKLQDSSTQQPTVMARTAEYVSNLITSGLWTTDNDRARIIDSTSSPALSPSCCEETGRLTPVVPRRNDRYYLLLVSIVFKYSCRSICSIHAVTLWSCVSELTYVLMHHPIGRWENLSSDAETASWTGSLNR